MTVATEVRPGQVYIGGQGPEHLRCQYHVLAVYEGYVWTLVVYPGVSADGQPEEPRNYTTKFFEHCSLWRDPRMRVDLEWFELIECPACNDGPEGDPVCGPCDGTGRVTASMLEDFLSSEKVDNER